MEIVELNFSRLLPEEFELLCYSLLNTALSCTDASIRIKVYELRRRIINQSKTINLD